MRTVNFFGSPINKFIILLFSVFSFLHVILRLLLLRTDHGANPIVQLVRLLSVPLGPQLMICLTVFYQTRHLEKCIGSHNYVRLIASSYLVSIIVLVSFRYSVQSQSLPSGCLVYVLFGIVVTMTILRLRASHTRYILGIQFTSHILLLTAAGLLIVSSRGLFPSFITGALGAATIHWSRLIPFPQSFISAVVNGIIRLCKEKPPQLLSGATLNVQRQQRMDLLEGYIMNFQQATDAQLARGAAYIPTDGQVQQLSQMGFRPEECRQALAAANGNIGFAIQLLTTNRPE